MHRGQTPLAERRVRRVGVAEYAVVDDGSDITTSGLGSCLGVALVDSTAGVAGLAHVMLPTDQVGRDGGPAKFADTGIRALFGAMERAGASADRTVARLAGASQMFDFSGSPPVGERNVAAAHEALDSLGIPIVGEDVGGGSGRSLRLLGASGELLVRTADGDEYTV